MAPVMHNGYWLVDGAVVNPVPVSLALAMGADIVIAVDLQHDAHLMQQDLLSMEVPRPESEEDSRSIHGCALAWRMTSRRVTSANGDGNYVDVYSGSGESPQAKTAWRATRLIF